MRRCGLLVLCCVLAVTVGDTTETDLLRALSSRSHVAAPIATGAEKPVLRSAARVAGDAEPVTLISELRDAQQLAEANASLVTAMSELERQARLVTSPLLRASFAERASELLLLTSDVQIMRDRPLAALWFSDRARQVVTRTFGSTPHETAGDAERFGQELVSSIPAGTTAIHQELRPDQLLTWVVRDGELHFVSSPVRSAALAADIERLRTSPERIQAERLYDMLLGPVRQYVTNAEMVVFSTAPALRGIPFALLHDGESFLIQRHTIVVTQSLSTFVQRWGRTVGAGNGAALIMLPASAPGSPPLQGAREEARVVANTYGARGSLVLDAAASSTTFMATASQFDVIHIGTHGHADALPLQSGIEFGSDLVRAWQILSLRLTRRPVVVLAGCRTSDETEGQTTVAVSSAFVTAGASAVVGALWDVEDQSTARLMIDFHQHLSQGVSAANALALAQRSAIAGNEPISVWAAFQVQM